MTGADDSGQIRSAVTQVTRRGADLRAIDDQLTQCRAISRAGKRARLRASDARSFGRPRRLALASLLPASLTFDAAFGTVSRCLRHAGQVRLGSAAAATAAGIK